MKAQAKEMITLKSKLEELESGLTELKVDSHGDGSVRERRSAPSKEEAAAAAAAAAAATAAAAAAAEAAKAGKSSSSSDSDSGGRGPNPYNAKMDPCPKMGKEQAMGEWTNLVNHWFEGLSIIVRTGEGRVRVHVAMASGLDARPRIKTAWMRMLAEQKRSGDPLPSLETLLKQLKDNVVAEEVTVAREEFRARKKLPDESFSEYKMALMSLGGTAYEGYDQKELEVRVLEQFLEGMGPAGESVRLQAPKVIEDAIAKAIAYEHEQTKGATGGKERVYAFSRRNFQGNFQGNCHKCGKRGHRAVECRSEGANQAGEAKFERKCYVCGKPDHIARFCPDKK